MSTVRLFIHTGFYLARRTVNELIKDEGYRIAAEASFYLIFSIFPLLFLFFVLLAQYGPLIYTPEFSRQLPQLFADLIPPTTMNMVLKQLEWMRSAHLERDLIISVVLFIWPASNVMYAYIDAVCQAYGAPNQRNFLQSRLVAMGLLLATGLLFFGAFLLLSLGPLAARLLGYLQLETVVVSLFQTAQFLGSFVLMTPSLALLYYFGPDFPERGGRSIWPGALLATLLWILVSYLYGLYIAYFNTYKALYGTLGGAMLLLMWMYLTSMVMVLGAEFNVVYRSWREGSEPETPGSATPSKPSPG